MSVESLAGLLPVTDLAGLSVCDLALEVEALSLSIFFCFLPASSPEHADCSVPRPSTAPITDTEARSTREGLGECTLFSLGVEENSDSNFLVSCFSFLI